ncbi:hypothetical protein ACFYZH_20445 [Streptomyces abikoensis]|uniref:hypothetical protein n=1 Tax=Streptomyces abikoensis TaxID=97398 RepID=UPI0036C9895C
MTYLAVFESDSWRLESEELAQALAHDWPDAQVEIADPGSAGSEVRAVEWQYPSESGDLEGYSHADGKCIYLEGPISVVADFVVWYRGLVDADVQVVFCDDAYSFDGIVPAGATKEEVLSIAE